MSFLTGSRSTFYNGLYTVDLFTSKTKGDVISSEDWNKLGDAIYNVEKVLTDLENSNQTYKLHDDSDTWMANMSIDWGLSLRNQLSVTGKIIIPSTACVFLGTSYPLKSRNLVKVQVKMDNALTYGNITSAIWCPYNRDDWSTYTASMSSTEIDLLARTIYVGLYFDGYPPPDDLNFLGTYVSVLIMHSRNLVSASSSSYDGT